MRYINKIANKMKDKGKLSIELPFCDDLKINRL